MSDLDKPLSRIRVAGAAGHDPYDVRWQYLDLFLQALPSEAPAHVMIERAADLFRGHHAMGDWVAELFATGMKLAAGATLTREKVEYWILNTPGFTEHFSSRAMAKMMWEQGAPKNGIPNPITHYNDSIYTHEKNGELNRIRSDDLVKLFAKGKQWPQLILTTNHARTRSSDDVSGIMKNVAALLRHTLGREHVVLERHPERVEEAGGKTIVVAALHAEDTSSRNGASVIFRNDYMRDHTTLDARVCPNRAEQTGIDLVEADLRQMSPAAIRLAKLMLKLISEEPSSIDVDERRVMMDLRRDDAPPLILRDDAAEIVRHITGIGFSMGAQTVNDMARFLAFELRSKHENGTPVFARRGLDGQVHAIQVPEDVAAIIAPLGIIGANGPGVPLTEEEVALGLGDRVRLYSDRDVIAGHFRFADRHRKPTMSGDKVHVVHGTARTFGHDGDEAFGLETEQGYLTTDAQSLALIGGVVGPKYGVEIKARENVAAR